MLLFAHRCNGANISPFAPPTRLIFHMAYFHTADNALLIRPTRSQTLRTIGLTIDQTTESLLLFHAGFHRLCRRQ